MAMDVMAIFKLIWGLGVLGILIVFAVVLLLAGIVLWYTKYRESKEIEVKENEWEVVSKRLKERRATGGERKEEPVKREETDRERLIRKERELRERGEKIKAEKRKELEEKERDLERKKISELAKDERKRIEGIGEEAFDMIKLKQLQDERNRILNLIELAESRFQRGGMSEKNFRKIIQDYQNRIVEIDVETARIKK